MSIDLVDSPSHSPLALPGKVFEDSVSLESSYIVKERKREWYVMNLAAANVWEGLTAQIQLKYFFFFKIWNTPEYHHAFLVTLGLLILRSGLSELQNAHCLIITSCLGPVIPAQTMGFSEFRCSSMWHQHGLPIPIQPSRASGPGTGCNDWLVKQGISLFPLHSGILAKPMREVPRQTGGALLQSISPSTTSAT